MAMADTSPSPFDPLPTHIWEKILSNLPLSSLVVSSAVCRRWKSLIKSQPFISLYSSLPHPNPNQDLFLLLLLLSSTSGAAYLPFSDRWTTFPLPSSDLRLIHASAGSLILSEKTNGDAFVCDPFSGETRLVPKSPETAYAVAMIEDGTGFRIISVSTRERVRSQVYDSRIGRWELSGECPGRFAVLGNSACLDGVIYCLSNAPDRVLKFEVGTGVWSVVGVSVPALSCSYVLVWNGRLCLVGGVEELGEIGRIGVWALDWDEMRWNEVGFMPEGLLRRLSGDRMNRFEVVERRGVVCFCNTTTFSFVFCDLERMRWWRPTPCPFVRPACKMLWVGHALEPSVGVLRPNG